MRQLHFVSLGILALALSVSTAFAQNTVPRFGITTNQDNTGRVMTWKYLKPTDAAGADTVKLYPRAYTTLIQYSAVDSLSFNVTNLTGSYVGDELQFIVTNASGSGHLVKFVGSNWQVGSGGAAITLTASKRANINFIFDGVFWVETSRVVQ